MMTSQGDTNGHGDDGRGAYTEEGDFADPESAMNQSTSNEEDGEGHDTPPVETLTDESNTYDNTDELNTIAKHNERSTTTLIKRKHAKETLSAGRKIVSGIDDKEEKRLHDKSPANVASNKKDASPSSMMNVVNSFFGGNRNNNNKNSSEKDDIDDDDKNLKAAKNEEIICSVLEDGFQEHGLSKFKNMANAAGSTGGSGSGGISKPILADFDLTKIGKMLFDDVPKDICDIKAPKEMKDVNIDYVNKVLAILVILILSVHLLEFISVGVVTFMMNRQVLTQWQYANMTSAFVQLKIDHFDMLQTKDKLEKSIEGKTKALEASVSENRELTSRLSSLQNENHALTKQDLNVHDNVRELNSAAQSITKERDSLKSQLEQLATEKHHREQHNADLINQIQQKNEEITRLTTERNDLQKKQNDLSDKVARGNNDLQAKVDDYKSQIDSKTKEVAALQNESNQKLQTITDLSAQIVDLKNEHDALHGSLGEYGGAQAPLGNSNERSLLQSKINEYETKLQLKDSEISSLNTELSKERINHGNLQMKVQANQYTLAEIDVPHINNNNNNYLLQQQQQRHNEEKIEELMEEKSTLKSKVKTLKSKLDDKDEKVEKLKEKIDTIKKNSKKLEKEYKHYKKAFKLMDKLDTYR